MPITSIGDLASFHLNRQSGTRLMRDLQTLGQEFSTGITQDPSTKLKGLTDSLSAIERGISVSTAYSKMTTEVKLLADSSQLALGSLQTKLQDVLDQSALVIRDSEPTALRTASKTAREQFVSAVADLNSQVSGRSLFGGISEGTPALKDGADIFQDLLGVVATASTPAEFETRMAEYFSDGGDFETNAYLGASQARSEFKLGPEDTVTLSLRADDTRIKDVLKSIARVALMGEDLQSMSESQKSQTVASGFANARSSMEGLIQTQAEVGTAQAGLERSKTRIAAEVQVLQEARLDRIGVDRYETIVKFRNAESQLEALYSISARMANLTMTSFLR